MRKPIRTSPWKRERYGSDTSIVRTGVRRVGESGTKQVTRKDSMDLFECEKPAAKGKPSKSSMMRVACHCGQARGSFLVDKYAYAPQRRPKRRRKKVYGPSLLD